MSDPLSLARELRDRVDTLRFSPPVACVYNPLRYAWALHEQYLRRFAATRKKVLFLGMNPGPFGMTQTGVPFGEIAAVRDWMGLTGAVERPTREHPKRPIQGLACPRSEVSGRRLWGLFAQRFGTAEAFFAEHLVVNWCPLVFMSESGANLTPDKLPAAELRPLEAACDHHLAGLIEVSGCEVVVGVGKIAAAAAERAGAPRVVDCPHPSPANPAANRDWAGAATRALVAGGVWRAA
jgi:single-strand selective monofunctional uracil DNA glycosylase